LVEEKEVHLGGGPIRLKPKGSEYDADKNSPIWTVRAGKTEKKSRGNYWFRNPSKLEQ